MNKKSLLPRRLIWVGAVMALPLAAVAGEGPYLGAEGGANWQRHQPGLGNAGFDHGYIGGLTLGHAYANGLRPEFELDYRRNNLDSLGGSSNVSGYSKAYTAMGNLWYDIRTDRGFFSVVHPYIGGGIGYARVTAENYTAPPGAPAAFTGDDHLFAYQAGAGIGFDVSRSLTLSVDYRALRTQRGDFATAVPGVSAQDRYQAQSAMVGLRYAFDAPAPKPMPVAALPPAPVMTPPPPAPVVAPPRDSDGDGVLDDNDRCPNTPAGFTVDSSGCMIKQTVVLRGVNFEFDSDRMTVPARETLDHVADAIKAQPGLEIEIDGHTDSRGSDAYNQRLSQRRADAVRSYLVTRGVEGRTLVARGFGESRPVASNDTDEGRTENRRVEFVVLNAPQTVKVINKDPTEQSKAAAETNDKPVKKARHKKAKK